MSDSSLLEQVKRCADKIGCNDMMRAIMAKVWLELNSPLLRTRRIHSGCRTLMWLCLQALSKRARSDALMLSYFSWKSPASGWCCWNPVSSTTS